MRPKRRKTLGDFKIPLAIPTIFVNQTCQVSPFVFLDEEKVRFIHHLPCQVKYRLALINSYRFEKPVRYKAVVKVVKVDSIQVQFTGDGSTAILETDVLCNTRSFRYFDSDSNATDIRDEASYMPLLFASYTSLFFV